MQLPPRIEVDDGLGNKISISAPVLRLLFWSDDLQKSYEKEPNRRYSVKDLVEMMDPKVTQAALCRIKGETTLFVHHGTELRVEKSDKRKNYITDVNVFALKPIVKKIFTICNELKKEYRKNEKD